MSLFSENEPNEIHLVDNPNSLGATMYRPNNRETEWLLYRGKDPVDLNNYR